jgi:hypothetical protein
VQNYSFNNNENAPDKCEKNLSHQKCRWTKRLCSNLTNRSNKSLFEIQAINSAKFYKTGKDHQKSEKVGKMNFFMKMFLPNWSYGSKWRAITVLLLLKIFQIFFKNCVPPDWIRYQQLWQYRKFLEKAFGASKKIVEAGKKKRFAGAVDTRPRRRMKRKGYNGTFDPLVFGIFRG